MGHYFDLGFLQGGDGSDLPRDDSYQGGRVGEKGTLRYLGGTAEGSWVLRWEADVRGAELPVSL